MPLPGAGGVLSRRERDTTRQTEMPKGRARRPLPEHRKAGPTAESSETYDDFVNLKDLPNQSSKILIGIGFVYVYL